MSMRAFGAVAAATVLGLSGVASGQCEPAWSDAFGAAFLIGGDQASATVFDDGSGPKLVLTGVDRSEALGSGLQIWDGQSWSELALPPGAAADDGFVRAFNEHEPPRLVFVETDSAHAKVREVYIFEGGVWRATGFPDGELFRAVTDIETGSDPEGPELFIGGRFHQGSGVYSLVYRWDGNSWAPIDAGGVAGDATSLAWFDDGSGLALYAGIDDLIDGVPASGAARWDGQTWEEVGGGCPASWPTIAVHDDGDGPTLWALDTNGAMLAEWDGVAWIEHPLDPAPGRIWTSLTSVPNDGSSELYWIERDGRTARLWRWDGAGGAPVAEASLGTIWDIAPDAGGGLGGGVFVAGTFRRVDGAPAASSARWDGSAWHALGNEEVGNGVRGVGAVLAVEPSAGPLLGGRVYVGARDAGGLEAGGVAAWDGARWAQIGIADSSENVRALEVGDLGDGLRLFAAGSIRSSDGTTDAIAAWDGQAWSSTGGALPRSSAVLDLAFGSVFGGEPTLYFCGRFETLEGEPGAAVGGLTADGWVSLGGGLPDSSSAQCNAIELHNDGFITALYADAPSRPRNPDFEDSVLRWDGVGWDRVGEPLRSESRFADVFALLSADLGDGSRLYAGGDFEGPGSTLQNIASWDGHAWRPLGEGVPGPVYDLEVVDLGAGPRLAAACTSPNGGQFPEQVWLWDGVSWAPFGAEADGRVEGIAQAVFDSGAVYLAGDFVQIAGTLSEGIARFGCASCVADFNDDGVVDTRDVLAFLNLWAAGDEAADINEDGFVDTRDVLAFLNLWNAGC